MNENKLVSNFKSYLAVRDLENPDLDVSDSNGPDLSPKRLPGEMIVAEAPNALMFAPASDNNLGVSGQLTVTNFKLSFVTARKRPEEDQCFQQSFLLGEQEVCLQAIDNIYHIVDKRRRLLPSQQKVPDKIKEIVVVCKNFRVLTFGFKFSPIGSGRKIANALLHHSLPTRHTLLFAYEFKEPYYRGSGSFVRDFRDRIDWERELERTSGKNRVKWRISTANENFQVSHILPRCIVVPADIVDHQLYEAARHFRCGSVPIWVWSSKNGAALVRMADIQATITDRVQENIMLENVRKCHPTMKQPVVVDLTKDMPSAKDVYSSYLRLRELCAPESLRQFWTQDRHFYALLDSTKWLSYVSQCLKKASETANYISTDTTVAIQEGDGCDMCCLISSLTQILLDPFWRTILGFQTLVQKEWVALGHPFDKRLGFILSKTGNERSPLFLLFLDCVWQLLQQYPCAFEFTETYLTTVWDSAHISIFDTFLFDSERRRLMATEDKSNPITLRSVWDWNEQFSEKDIALFRNPLFDSTYVQRIQPECKVLFLEIWALCYFRWIPHLEIPKGGPPQIDLFNRAIVADINLLQQQILNSSSSSQTQNQNDSDSDEHS
ncbi:myotubularin-related protein 10-B isoform X2 [Chrysoperla carnea]|uniref:myotubularin-related protein 10-B isoform X2 n=1 Tax=Chrysoperla carnea TaxID=189513 RepID=UPI001D07C186|nr:myotubularin-related protein 10-B isoform X2 [Chrysoperla carnea]